MPSSPHLNRKRAHKLASQGRLIEATFQEFWRQRGEVIAKEAMRSAFFAGGMNVIALVDGADEPTEEDFATLEAMTLELEAYLATLPQSS